MPIKVVPSLPENPEILEKNNYIKFLLSVKWQKKKAFGYLQRKKYSLYRNLGHLFLPIAERPSGQHPPVHQTYMCELNFSFWRATYSSKLLFRKKDRNF
jgi:hypothetical protein